MMISFIFFIFYVYAKKEIVQVQLLTRHGDRTSIYTSLLSNCPIDFMKLTGIEEGALTPLGEYQCYNMGIWLRNRYIDNSSSYHVKDLSSFYNRHEYEFMTSQHHRTMRSAWSVTKGLFPVGHKIDIGNKNYSLPFAAQSVPVMMVYESANDRLFVEGDICTAKINQFKEWLASREGKDTIELLNRQYMDSINSVAGTDYSILDIIHVQDLAVILDDHNLLSESELKGCHDLQHLIPFIQNASAAWFETWYTNSLPSFIGGGFMSFYTDYLDAFFTSKGKEKRFIHYSGHDSSLLYLMFGLEIQKDYHQYWHQPYFGSALVFELWTDDDFPGKYFVQVVFRNGWNGEPVNLKLKSFGCDDYLCDLDVFEQMIKKKLTKSTEEWCRECDNNTAEYCKK